MGKYNDPEYWKNIANEEIPTRSNGMEPCECKARPNVTEVAKELNQNLLDIKDVIDSIVKCIFGAVTDETVPSNGTIDSLYDLLVFDREVSTNLVKNLKYFRDMLG